MINEEKVVVKIANNSGRLKDATFYEFDATRNRSIDFYNNFEYADELDIAVEQGYAVRVSGETVFEAYKVLKRSLFMIDSMLQSGEIEGVRMLISDTIDQLRNQEIKKEDILIVE
tara:strand:+ start:250 stop:594 length:345 start_codon:yes stop_codon:yes gene_type:complete